MSDVNEFNVETGQYILRPYTQEELEQVNIDRNVLFEPETVLLPEDPIITSALSKLKSLGLTKTVSFTVTRKQLLQ